MTRSPASAGGEAEDLTDEPTAGAPEPVVGAFEEHEPATLHRASGRTGLGIALALSTVCFWSILPLGLKIVLREMDAFTLTWYRFVAAALVLGAILERTGGLPPLRALDRRHWGLLAVATVFLCTNYVLYVLGLERTNAGTSQVLIQLAPLLLGLGGVWVYGERLSAPQWLGFGVMVSGLLLFSYEQLAHVVEGSNRYLFGVALIVVAAVAWAIYGLAQKQLLRRMRSPAILLCFYAGGAVLFAPFAHPAKLLTLGATELAALVFCIANMLVAYGTFAESLEHLDASRVSAILAIVPLSTLGAIAIGTRVLPGLVAPEPLTGPALAGAVMVVVGSLATALGRGTRGTSNA